MDMLTELFAIALGIYIIKGSIDIGKEFVKGITWIARTAYKEMTESGNSQEL